jgi:hypothetical protein
MVRHNDNHDWKREENVPRARPADPVPASPEEEEFLERVAEFRAVGHSWDKTAIEFHTTTAELKALTKRYHYLFRRIMFRADREMARDDRRVAASVFRKQINKDPLTQAARLSAQFLSNIALT